VIPGALLSHGQTAALKASQGIGAAIDWLAARPVPKPPPPLPYQGPSPDDLGPLVMRAARDLKLEDAALRRAADRLREGGYHEAARNYGSIRCLVAHAHGTDSRCIACQDAEGKSYFLRCFGSDERALRQLLVVARARSMVGPVAPPCDTCRTRDADLRAGAWTTCRTCRAEQARRAEQDPAFVAVRNARDKLRQALHGKAWFRGIGIGSDGRGNATLELRVSKLTPKVKRFVPDKVQDENGAWIAVGVEAVGDIVAQAAPTELGGYRSMEVHSKAPRVRASMGSGVLDDLGATPGDELADSLNQDASPSDELLPPEAPEEHRTATEALEDKVHELAAAWAGLKERMRERPALAQLIDPLHQKWQDFWARWETGSTEALEGIVDDTNAALAGAEAEQAEYQLTALKAQAQTHNLAIQEALQGPTRDEPEFQEYAKRWKAWIDKLKETIDRHESKLQWAKELLPFGEARRLTEVHGLQDEFNGFLSEWDLVKMRIAVRKGESGIKTLEEGTAALKKVKADQATEEEKAAAAKALLEKQKIEEASAKGKSAYVPDLPASAATKAPSAPPDAPAGPLKSPLSFLMTSPLTVGAALAVAALVALKTIVGR